MQLARRHLPYRQSAEPRSGAQPRPEPLGSRARRIFRDYRLFTRANYPPYPIAHHPIGKPIALLLAIAWFGGRIAPRVRRATGVPIGRQLVQLCRLGFGEGIDALTYYLQELYRPGGMEAARYYLTRYETKNGLFSALNRLAPSPYGVSEMTDKLLFADCCRRFRIAAPEVLVAIEGGELRWRTPDPAALDCDLFAKPRRGKGARGTSLFRRVAAGRYLAPDGATLSLDALLARLQEQSQTTPMLLQRRLRNHASLADLATDSLAVIRVITCLDERGEPEATHGMLRVLAKLEPSWHSRLEFGAPIDLETGELGMLTGDKAECCLDRYDAHPITGSAILGRRFKGWPQIRDLAIATHRHFPHRVIVGWDLAFTSEGPMVLEGNNVLDISFPQRTHACPIGRSRLGELLHFHLDRLCASKEAARSAAAAGADRRQPLATPAATAVTPQAR
jgi:hypothetical protein